MSNSTAVQPFPSLINDEPVAEIARPSIAMQPDKGMSVPHVNTEQPTLENLVEMYAAQDRECWLCEGVSKKIASDEEISEDDSWHFTSCVLSWEYLNKNQS